MHIQLEQVLPNGVTVNCHRIRDIRFLPDAMQASLQIDSFVDMAAFNNGMVPVATKEYWLPYEQASFAAAVAAANGDVIAVAYQAVQAAHFVDGSVIF
jgi:hypothetical protein